MGSGGILEKDLNLAVAGHLQHFLEQGGTHVIVTRADDNGIYDTTGSIRSKKNSDLKNREKLIAESNADAFVSIHMNKFPDGKYSGPQVFYSKNHPGSEALAKSVQSCLTESLHPPMVREVKQADGSIYLLNTASIPAILVECGFLSNEAEEKKLMDETYQKQIAWAIYCGMINYFNEA